MAKCAGIARFWLCGTRQTLRIILLEARAETQLIFLADDFDKPYRTSLPLQPAWLPAA
jgi:hypothetical protein